MVTLRKIDRTNIREALSLGVDETQTGFVASNTESIIEAYLALSGGIVALPFCICADGVPVGFAMLGYGATDEDAPKIAQGNYCLWRFMIDRNHQRRGYGTQALARILDYIRTMPCGEAEYVYLSYDPENEAAKRLYTGFGFVENGEMDGDEIVAVRRI